MIKRILLWLISIYLKPATTETKTPEVEIMSDQPVVVPAVVSSAVADEVKAGVADFDAALSFVESGVSQLGEAAKDELKELAKKYL
ncbi:hypothetical protein AB6896_07290 [Rahnella inusitata]|uniref:hypothetical protein n=1 Tax=Rahnella inusitata TaxID=58169 RepID=UPI0039BDC3E1